MDNNDSDNKGEEIMVYKAEKRRFEFKLNKGSIINDKRCRYLNPWVLLFLLSFLNLQVTGQYLTVTRKSAKIRKHHAINSHVIEKVIKGTHLIMLKEANSQTNNYYKVRCSAISQDGWIHRTDVKKIKGDLPAAFVISGYKYATNIFNTGQIPQDYYSSVEGLEGEQLKTGLHRIIRNHKIFTYDEVYSILGKTDQDPYDTMNVVLLYTARTVNKNHKDRGGRYDYNKNGYLYEDAWNREHVWPKSFGFANETDTAYTDLHHIRPADRTINTERNNRSFDYGTEPYSDNDGKVKTECFTSTEWTWEPPDFVKGDIARMIFYMAVRYEGYDKDGLITGDLEVVDEIPAKGSKEPNLGKLSTLLEWHKQDPVDNWERRRNDIIFKKYQGNRNPFIDHPEFVEKIWQN